MVEGGPVDVQVRFPYDALSLVEQLTEEAIQRAIEATKLDIQSYAMNAGITPVPIDTGRLMHSFDIASTPRSIVFRWSAVDPDTGYNYARIQDEGGPIYRGAIMLGKHYSDVMREYARERLIYHLQRELSRMQAVTP